MRTKLHWDALDRDKLKETIWKNSSKLPSVSPDVESFEKIFCYNPESQNSENQKSKDNLGQLNQQPPTIVNLLPLKRANNISITLSRFNKRISFSEMKKAIQTFSSGYFNFQSKKKKKKS